MEIKLINEQQKLMFDAKTLDEIFKIAEFSDDDIWLVGTLFYIGNQAYCNDVNVLPQTIRYQNIDVDVKSFNSEVQDLQQTTTGVANNLIIVCKGKKAPSIYSADEKVFKELIELYGEGYLMSVNKDSEFKINYYNYNCGISIENMEYSVDVSNLSDLKDDDIRKMIENNVKRTTYYSGTSTQTVNPVKKEDSYVPSELVKQKPTLNSLT